MFSSRGLISQFSSLISQHDFENKIRCYSLSMVVCETLLDESKYKLKQPKYLLQQLPLGHRSSPDW